MRRWAFLLPLLLVRAEIAQEGGSGSVVAPEDGDGAASMEFTLDGRPIDPSEVYLCRHCGAIIARGEHFLPGTQEYEDLLPLLEVSPDRSSPSDGIVVQPPKGDAVFVLAFSRTEALYSQKGSLPQQEGMSFPEYKWLPSYCPECEGHVGWVLVHSDVEQTPPYVASPVETHKGRKLRTAKKAAKARAFDETEAERLLSELKGTCLRHRMGWWTYEWCHREEVLQMHVSPSGEEDPKYSLGKFDNDRRVERSRPVSGEPSLPPGAYYHSHFFRGGQVCHEINQYRSTEVQFFCCPSETHPRIANLAEPSLCKYRLQVCLPSVCEDNTPERGDEAEGGDSEEVVHEERKEQDHEQREGERNREESDGETSLQRRRRAPSSFFFGKARAIISSKSPEFQWIEKLPLRTGVLS